MFCWFRLLLFMAKIECNVIARRYIDEMLDSRLRGNDKERGYNDNTSMYVI